MKKPPVLPAALVRLITRRSELLAHAVHHAATAPAVAATHAARTTTVVAVTVAVATHHAMRAAHHAVVAVHHAVVPAHHVMAAMPAHLREVRMPDHTRQDLEAVLLAVVETLVERLLRVGEAFQAFAGLGHHLGMAAQPFDRTGVCP